MKNSRIPRSFDVVILTILTICLASYVVVEFIVSHKGLILAPTKTGFMPLLFVALVSALLAWCVEKLIYSNENIGRKGCAK